jgi:AraC-like DNA-binding protein
MKLSAYQAGAEAYITKPFDPRELLARISGLLINRNLTINKFNTSTSFDPGQLTKNPIDQQFISKANSITQKNISNPDFSSKELIQEMGMSRTAFFNKLKSLTGQSATEFIRTLRLKNAARMLQEKDNTITDVIYANGFNSREYFSRSFKQHFGVTPSKYKENVLLNTSLNNRS